MREFQELSNPEKDKATKSIIKVLDKLSSLIENKDYDERGETVKTLDNLKERIVNNFSKPEIDINIDDESYHQIVDEYLSQKEELLKYFDVYYLKLDQPTREAINFDFEQVIKDLELPTSKPIAQSKVKFNNPIVQKFIKDQRGKECFLIEANINLLVVNINTRNRKKNKRETERQECLRQRLSNAEASTSGNSDLSKMTYPNVSLLRTSTINHTNKRGPSTNDLNIEPKPKRSPKR